MLTLYDSSPSSSGGAAKKVPQLKLPGKNDRQSSMLRSRSSRRISKYVGSMAMGSARESRSEIDSLGPAYSVNSARGLQSGDEGTSVVDPKRPPAAISNDRPKPTYAEEAPQSGMEEMRSLANKLGEACTLYRIPDCNVRRFCVGILTMRGCD